MVALKKYLLQIGSTRNKVKVKMIMFQATSTVEVDMERAEKLQVTRTDFMASLENDIKPVSI